MIGQVHKWSAEDFSYIGIVTAAAAGRITMMTDEGELSFPEDDGTLKLLPNHKLDLEAPIKKAAPAPAKKAPKAGSNLAKAHEVIAEAWPVSRPEGMALIKEALDCGDGTASTYFASAKRALS